MKHKIKSLLLIILPIIVAFDYVVATRLIDDAKIAGDPRIFHQFYYVVVSTAIFHLIWAINIILIFMGAFENQRFWRILTTMVIFQVILLYGLGVYMSLFLGKQIYLRDNGVATSNLDYYIIWSAVSVGCLWFDFIIFLMIVIQHVYQQDEFTQVKVEDPSRMERT